MQRNPGVDVVSEDYYQITGSERYYDLDLTEVVSFKTDSREALDFDVSEACNWAEVQAAVNAGRLVRVNFMENEGLRKAAVLLTDAYTVENVNAYYLQSVYAPRGGTNYFKLRLEFAYDEEFENYDALVIFTPGSGTSYSYGTEDLVAGESELETGTLYFVYE